MSKIVIQGNLYVNLCLLKQLIDMTRVYAYPNAEHPILYYIIIHNIIGNIVL